MIPLLSKLLVIYFRDERIIYQCVSSLAVLSFTLEGQTYLKNTEGIMVQLQKVLAQYEDNDDIANLTTIALTKLGCTVLSFVCFIIVSFFSRKDEQDAHSVLGRNI